MTRNYHFLDIYHNYMYLKRFTMMHDLLLEETIVTGHLSKISWVIIGFCTKNGKNVQMSHDVKVARPYGSSFSFLMSSAQTRDEAINELYDWIKNLEENKMYIRKHKGTATVYAD